MNNAVSAAAVDESVVIDFTCDTVSQTSSSVLFDVDASVDVDADLDSDSIKMTFLATFTWESQKCTPPWTLRNEAVLSTAEMHVESGSERDLPRSVGGDLPDFLACVPWMHDSPACMISATVYSLPCTTAMTALPLPHEAPQHLQNQPDMHLNLQQHLKTSQCVAVWRMCVKHMPRNRRTDLPVSMRSDRAFMCFHACVCARKARLDSMLCAIPCTPLPVCQSFRRITEYMIALVSNR